MLQRNNVMAKAGEYLTAETFPAIPERELQVLDLIELLPHVYQFHERDQMSLVRPDLCKAIIPLHQVE